jgi:hypothetical protein
VGRTKLSGKRTVTGLNPGKNQALGLGTEGDKSQTSLGIISQVNRQEERCQISHLSSFFILISRKHREVIAWGKEPLCMKFTEHIKGI